MSLAISYSAQLVGLASEIVIIEVDITHGLHAFSVVGLGDRSVEESKDRISAAIKNCGFTSPKQKNQKVVISLAPADAKKEGPSFDLAMAIAYLKAAKEIDFLPEKKLFLGELSLEGKVRRVNGLLPILCQAGAQGFTEAFIPKENEAEASLAQGITIYVLSSLSELISHINGEKALDKVAPHCFVDGSLGSSHGHYDVKYVRGNETAKRALEIAASGGHNIVMSGPPGTGKTMLANSFCSILPDLTYEESVEVTGIHSAARILGNSLVTRPPFRSPHHTASFPSIVGGGSFPKPGEITLAHRGVLFLDEFPEFDRSVIEALRQPLEERTITISRARASVTFPAQCILIASMNPCPCGKGKDRGCTCTEREKTAYRRKISGPIMDRLDIWISVHKVDYEKLSAKSSVAESSREIALRVRSARAKSSQRFASFGISKRFNSEMHAADIEKLAFLGDDARTLLTSSAKKLEMSGRAFHRTIKVARTIADMDDSEEIKEGHILEALQYRQKPI